MAQMTTFTTLIKDLPEPSVQAIESYAAIYGRVERLLYADLIRGQESQSELKKRYIREHQITARQFNAIWRGLNGKLQSKKELTKLYIGENKERIKALSSTISSLQAKVKSLKDTGGSADRIAKFANNAHQKSRRLAIIQRRLGSQFSDKDRSIPTMCFGSKKLLNAQHHLEQNNYSDHQAWLDDWRRSRDSHFYVLGSKDESWGNQGAQLIPTDDGKFTLLLRLPEAIGGGRIEIADINFKYGKDSILKACEMNQHRQSMGSSENLAKLASLALASDPEAKTTKSLLLSDYGQAITVRFNRHKFGWQLAVSVDEDSLVDEFVGFENGALGVDVNVDHLAVTIVNKQGNKVYSTNIDCPLSGSIDANKREALIGEATKQVVELAKEYGVGISYENLDFQKKKRALKETQGKQHRSMLNSFAYNIVLSFLARRAFRHGIIAKSVSPACTSIIGKLKYQSATLSTHQAAAMVIARRGLGLFFEKIRLNVPTSVGVSVSNAPHATVSMPADSFKRWVKVNKLMNQYRGELFKPKKTTVNLKVIDSSLRLAA